jgi:hypothetical protein
VSLASPETFAHLLARLARAQGERVSVETCGDGREAFVRQTSWNLLGGTVLPPEAFEAWAGLWEGLAAVHADPPGLRLDVLERLDLGDPYFEWRIRRRR